MKYGMIGLGNMGGAVLKGMLVSGSFAQDEICGFDRLEEKCDTYKAAGVKISDSIEETASGSDVLILAVKPQQMPDVLNEVKKCNMSGKLVISIAAGLTTEYFEKQLPGSRVVRAMPNLNAVYREAVTALCAGESAGEEDLAAAEKIFGSVGTAVRIAESQFAVFSAVAGASPAFVFMFADALAMAGVRAGLPRDLAQKIAAAAVRGSGTTLQESGEHPSVLRDRVCSPGGTTIEGVRVLEEEGMVGDIMDAVAAVIEKDRTLGK